VGDFADPQSGVSSRPVKSGEEGVTVTCRVAPTGSGFAVNATITSGGTTLEVSGDVDASGNTANGKMTLGSWQSTMTKLDTSGNAQFGIAAGRYWALFSTKATSTTSETCDIFGEIRVENCAQN
jgi:hypothetical protein